MAATTPRLRAHELYGSRGGLPGLSVPNKPDGFCGLSVDFSNTETKNTQTETAGTAAVSLSLSIYIYISSQVKDLVMRVRLRIEDWTVRTRAQ